MDNVTTAAPSVAAPEAKATFVYRGIGAILLFVVGYVHLALLVNMFGLSQMLGKLFLLNAMGAFAAMLWILISTRWFGWVLGILVSGGAAFAKLGMNKLPGLGSFIMGGRGRFGPGGPPPNGKLPAGQKSGRFPSGGHGNVPSTAGGHFAGVHAGQFGAGHSILPEFGNMGSIANVSIAVEIAFVILAVVVLVFMRRQRTV